MTPKLYIGIGKILYIGQLADVPAHRCMVPVFGAGLDHDFCVGINGTSYNARTQFITAGTLRDVKTSGGRLAVLLIDPDLNIAKPWDEAAALANQQRLAQEYSNHAWDGLHDALRTALT